MITLSYLHAILYLVVTFGLLCGLLSLRLENQRKARFIRTFENLLMRALRSRHGAEINLNGHAWRVTLAPVKAALNRLTSTPLMLASKSIHPGHYDHPATEDDVPFGY